MSSSSISQIRPYLYLSSYLSLNEQKLKQLGITHAVDATNMATALRVDKIIYFRVEIDDNEHSDLKQYFEKAIEFIKSAKEAGGKIIVYCAAGVSRSASIVLVYLMIHEAITLKEAYIEVVKIRFVIAPNIGFWRQMIAYEEEKSGESTVTLIQGKQIPLPDVYLNKSRGNNVKSLQMLYKQDFK